MDFIKKFSAIIISSLILIISAFLFLKHIANVSVPDDTRKINPEQINSLVKVIENNYGIPHVIALIMPKGIYFLQLLHSRSEQDFGQNGII